MVHATTFLTYPKNYVFALRPTYILYIVMILSFQNILHCSLISHEHVTSVTVSQFVFFVFYFSIKIRENKIEMKENKIETKSIVFNSDTILVSIHFFITSLLCIL